MLHGCGAKGAASGDDSIAGALIRFVFAADKNGKAEPSPSMNRGPGKKTTLDYSVFYHYEIIVRKTGLTIRFWDSFVRRLQDYSETSRSATLTVLR